MRRRTAARALALGIALLALLGAAGAAQGDGPTFALELSARPEAVLAGESITWTATLTHVAPERAPVREVLVHDVPPPGVTLNEARAEPGDCRVVLGAITCAVGTLAYGDEVRITIKGTVAPDFGSGTLVNTVSTTGFSAPGEPAQAVVARGLRTPVFPFRVAPGCAAAGESVTLVGGAFASQTLAAGDVTVGGVPAALDAASPTGLVVAVPQGVEGEARVAVAGLPGWAPLRVDQACSRRPVTTRDVSEGFVAGDILLSLADDVGPTAREALQAEYGLAALVAHPVLKFFVAKVDPEAHRERGDAHCPVSRRTTAPLQDILLLVDASGTMDESALRPFMGELLDQMECVVNRDARVGLIAYGPDARVALPLARWGEQQERLRAWLDAPLATRGHSDLARGLNQALAHLHVRGRPERPAHVLVLTRGPVSPPLQAPERWIARANALGIDVHGLPIVSRWFPLGDHDALQQVARGTGRGVSAFDERRSETAGAAATCALVWGVYGIQDCGGPDALARVPAIERSLSELTGALIRRLNADPRVRQAFPNSLVDSFQADEDPKLSESEWLLQLGLPAGWDAYFPKRGEGTSIAIVDSGADLALAGGDPAELVLDPKAPEGLNFGPAATEEGEPKGQDEVGHGTAVSTIAAAAGDNRYNGAGVAPRARLLLMKVFSVVDGQAKATNDGVAQALFNAFALGADVVNLSIGCHGCSPEQRAVQKAFFDLVIDNLLADGTEAGRPVPVLVAAAGNDGARGVDTPASHPAVIAVGSIRPDLARRSRFSNFGPELDLVAVGEHPRTTVSGGGFEDPGSGTSFAAPQVAGLSALVRAEHPELDPEAVWARILDCFVADVAPAGFDEGTGWGRVFLPPRAEADPACLNGD